MKNFIKKINKKFNIPSFVKGNIIGSCLLLLSFLIAQSNVFAWEAARSAESLCVTNDLGNQFVNIQVSFTNNDVKAISVRAQDNWTTQEVDLGTVNVGETKIGLIKTGQKNITNSSVTFSLSWADGSSGSETLTSNYNALDCVQPTPTPLPTDVPTPTTTPAPTAAAAPTPTPTSPTPTPVVININVVNPTNPTPTPQPVVLGAAAVNPTPAPKKLASAALAKTGTFTEDIMSTIMLMGTLFMMLGAGIYAKERRNKLAS